MNSITQIRYDFLNFEAILEFPIEAVDSISHDFDKIADNGAACESLVQTVTSYRENRIFDIGEVTKTAKQYAKECDINEYSAALIYYMCAAMYSYPAFEEKGLSKEEWFDSMADFRCKLFECHDRYGVWGTFVDWFSKWYTGDRMTYGRFAFEVIPCPVEFKEKGFNVEKGQKVIETHILNNKKKPFTEEAWKEAFKRAAAYFGDKLDGAEPVFFAYSWLLFPKNREFLPENSNIVKFMSEYTPGMTTPTKNDLWRIFNIADCNTDPALLDEDTSLRKAYKEFMLNGGEPACTMGFKHA